MELAQVTKTGEGLAARAASAPILQRSGTGWLAMFADGICQLGDAPGLHHLAALLASPDEPIPALVLEQRLLSTHAAPPVVRRELHDARERARTEVCAAISAALAELDERHPPLAAHLRATLTTGAQCVYQPARAPAWPE